MVAKLKLELVLLGFEPYTGSDNLSAALLGGAASLADFDKEMEKTVRDFQDKFGMEVTGVIDSTTADRLCAEREQEVQPIRRGRCCSRSQQ